MARILEQIVASLDDVTKKAIVMHRIGSGLDIELASEEEREGVVLVHVLEALRSCRNTDAKLVNVDAEMVAERLNENPFFFSSIQNLTVRKNHADNLWQFGCFPCSPVAG